MKQVEVKRRQIEMIACLIGLINILVFGGILGNGGIAYLAIGFVSFSLIRILISGSLTDVLGKMLRARNAKGQYKNALCIRRRVLLIQGIIGLVSSIVFAVCAGVVTEELFRVQYSTFIMMIMAPALFLRTVSAVLVGYFQGEGTELPAAVVAPLRQIVLMGFGLLFVNVLGTYGGKVSALLGDTAYTAMYGGVGIALAMNLAEVLILLFLGLILLGSRRSGRKKENEGMKQTDSLLTTVKIFYGAMWMPVLIRVLEVLPAWFGALFYRKSMADVGSFAENIGMLIGKYLVVAGIFVIMICVSLLSVNTKTVISYKKEDYRSAKNLFQAGLHIGMVHGLFFTVFVAVMAEQLAGLLSKTSVDAIAEMLRFGSILIVLAVLFYYFSEFLKAMGRKYHLLGVLCLMNILYMILTSVLLNMGTPGIMSLIYGAIVSLGIGCILLGFFCCRMMHTGIEWLQVLAIPAGGVCVTGLLSMFLGKLLVPHLGNLVTLLLCFLIAVIVYWVILLLFRSFRESELQYIPGGNFIFAVGQTLRIF